MFNRKFSSNIRRKKRMITTTVILLVVCLGIGYSAFSTNLGINGTLNVSKYDQTLYGVLEKAAKKGTYAKEYTGNHQDSMAGVGDKKIYHWEAPSTTAGNTLANEILDMNNVIFAGQCWQMIRTTDTGGVKMIYNGEVEAGKCLNTRTNHIGYNGKSYENLLTTYYYGTSYNYDKTNNVFSLDGTITTGTIQTGQYTCKQTTSTGTCATLYLVDSQYSGISCYVLPLNNSSHYSQFGTLQFNENYTSSPADVGYMYNTRYTHNSKTMTNTETMLSSYSLATTYWYAHDAIWGSPTAGRYNLDSPYQVSATTDYPNLVGEYTFRNTTQTYTNTSVYYIAAVNNTTMYYIQLSNSGNHTLSDFNYTYTYGESFTDNGNGTYTINSPTTVERKNWYTSYSSVGANKYVCKNAVNDTCSELWYTTSTSNTSMTYIKVENNYKYAKGFTWDGNKYVLDNDTSISFWNINDSTNKTSLNNAHYTCWNNTGECTTISYIYYISGTIPYYINISNGKSVEDAKNEMLYNDNVNTINSTIKIGVDAWYKQYLSDYSDYLEDTIFCNDRSQNNASTNGWNPNGGSLSTYMDFYGVSDLSCSNDTDKFSVSNNKAQLIYPVGLLTSHEIYLLNNNNIRKTGQSYWLASPHHFRGGDLAYSRSVYESGSLSSPTVNNSNGVRPAVSLTPGTEYTSGTGSMSDPYIVQ